MAVSGRRRHFMHGSRGRSLRRHGLGDSAVAPRVRRRPTEAAWAHLASRRLQAMMAFSGRSHKSWRLQPMQQNLQRRVVRPRPAGPWPCCRSQQ